MDAYLFILVRDTRASKQYGDIIEVRGENHEQPFGTDDDRRATVVIKVTDVPIDKAAAIKRRLEEPLENADPDDPVIMFRKLYLFGLVSKGRTTVNQFIATNYPALATALGPYTDPTVVQPANEIPSVSWTALRNNVFYFLAGRKADPDTEVEV